MSQIYKDVADLFKKGDQLIELIKCAFGLHAYRLLEKRAHPVSMPLHLVDLVFKAILHIELGLYVTKLVFLLRCVVNSLFIFFVLYLTKILYIC